MQKTKLLLNILALFLCILPAVSMAQGGGNVTVSGIVTSADDKQPLIGVNVISGAASGVSTLADGSYSISVAAGTTLTFQYIGYKPATFTVPGGSASLTYDVSLESEAQALDDVVVIAYGVRKKGTIAGSVSTVKAEKVENTPTAAFDQAIQGQVPGLTVLSNSGEPSTSATMMIRGMNSINSGTSPLYILDGVAIAMSLARTAAYQTDSINLPELRDNLQVIQDYKWMYNDEKRVAYRLKEHDFSLDGLPADTVAYYTRRITGSMGKPYRFLTDALEMFKTTGIASDIADKQIVIDLLRCYNELGAFDNSMNIYYDQRMKAILPEQMGETLWSADTNIDKVFGKMLASKKVRNWLGMIPRAFDSRYFETNEEKLETMIAELEKRYQ